MIGGSPPQNILNSNLNNLCSGLIGGFSPSHTDLFLPGWGVNLEEPISGYPAQPGLIHPSVCLSVRPSFCLSVRACRLGIERKMAQAQQIQSIIVNRKSEFLRKKVHKRE